jgi:inorganic pyrophosphatase
MTDEKGPDAKILSVPSSDPRFLNIRDLEDLPGHLTDEIAHFFEVYKALEPGKSTEVSEWEGAEAARTEIVEATRRAQVSH